MVDLLLVRHGQSTWNAEGRWQGQADPPLSAFGERQAAAAAAALPGHVDVVVASDLLRAASTARVLAEARGMELHSTLPALRERAAGPWEGHTRAEIEQHWPGYLSSGRRPDGYESDDDIVGRVLPALDGLLGLGEHVVAVSHGGVIRAVQRHLSGTDHPVPNLGASWLHHDGQRWTLGVSLELAVATVTDVE